METSPGLFSGKMEMSMPETIDVSAPEKTGERRISTMAEISPPYMLQTAPWVLKRRQ